MKTIALFALSFSLLLSPVTKAATATTTPVASGTLTNSLTISGYRFRGGPGTPVATAAAVPVSPVSFAASYALSNHTNAEIVVTAPGSANAPIVVFDLYDGGGKLIWTSWISPANPVAVQKTLKPGSAWKLTAQIPLRINNVWLDGTYSLVASVNGTPDFSATTTFVVAPANVVAGPAAAN